MRLCVSLSAFMTPAEWLAPAPAVHGLGPNNKTHMWQVFIIWMSSGHLFVKIIWGVAFFFFFKLAMLLPEASLLLLERRKIRCFMLASKSGFSVLCAHFNGFLHIFKNEIFKLTVLAETRCVVCWEHNDVTNFTMSVSGNHRFFKGWIQTQNKRNEIICSNVCHNAALWCVRPSNVISPNHHWPIAKLVTVDDLASSIEKKNIRSRISVIRNMLGFKFLLFWYWQAVMNNMILATTKLFKR